MDTAQRLEANCEPGKMLVSGEVYAQADRVLGPASERIVALKGKARPMTAFICEL